MLMDTHSIDYVFRDNEWQPITSMKCALFIYVPLDEYRRALREKRQFHAFSHQVSGPGVIVMSEADVNEVYLTQIDKAQNGIYPYMYCYVEVRLDRFQLIDK